MSLPSWSARKFATFIIGLALIAAGLLAFQFFSLDEICGRLTETTRPTNREGRPGGASLLQFRKIDRRPAFA